MIRRPPFLFALLLAAALAAPAAQAELPAELRVYDDSVGEPGEFGFEIHMSRTLRRSPQREANGELPTTRGFRLTPEISYGINDDTEISILFPTVIDSRGDMYLGGQQLQLKWLPLKAPEEGGWFAGINWELVTATRHFDAARNSVEIRPIVGYRNREWLLIANLLTSHGLTRGYRSGFEFSPAFKVSRAMGEELHLGVELYSEVGRLAHFAPRPEQTHTAFLTLDVERAGWQINLGLGRGLNTATDPWIVKAIIEFPMD